MSFLAEMIVSYFNQNCHTYSSSPFFTFAEEQIIKKTIGNTFAMRPMNVALSNFTSNYGVISVSTRYHT